MTKLDEKFYIALSGPKTAGTVRALRHAVRKTRPKFGTKNALGSQAKDLSKGLSWNGCLSFDTLDYDPVGIPNRDYERDNQGSPAGFEVLRGIFLLRRCASWWRRPRRRECRQRADLALLASRASELACASERGRKVGSWVTHASKTSTTSSVSRLMNFAFALRAYRNTT